MSSVNADTSERSNDDFDGDGELDAARDDDIEARGPRFRGGRRVQLRARAAHCAQGVSPEHLICEARHCSQAIVVADAAPGGSSPPAGSSVDAAGDSDSDSDSDSSVCPIARGTDASAAGDGGGDFCCSGAANISDTAAVAIKPTEAACQTAVPKDPKDGIDASEQSQEPNNQS